MGEIIEARDKRWGEKMEWRTALLASVILVMMPFVH